MDTKELLDMFCSQESSERTVVAELSSYDPDILSYQHYIRAIEIVSVCQIVQGISVSHAVLVPDHRNNARHSHCHPKTSGPIEGNFRFDRNQMKLLSHRRTGIACYRHITNDKFTAFVFV